MSTLDWGLLALAVALWGVHITAELWQIKQGLLLTLEALKLLDEEGDR